MSWVLGKQATHIHVYTHNHITYAMSTAHTRHSMTKDQQHVIYQVALRVGILYERHSRQSHRLW